MTNFQVYNNKWGRMRDFGFAVKCSSRFSVKFDAFANYCQHLETKMK